MSKPTRILVIEDNEDVRENLAEILELYGYEVDQAADGLEGVKKTLQQLPDLILCDVSMPDLDGYGVLNILSQQDTTASIPFVFITAKTEKEDIRRGMNLGADDYITKPFYKDELLSVVQLRLEKATRRIVSATVNTDSQLTDRDRGMASLAEAFKNNSREKQYQSGQCIVNEGEYPHFIYQVTEGRVHLVRSHEYGRDYIIANLGPGEFFGIPSVVGKTAYHYAARAATGVANCKLLGKEKFYELLSVDRNVAEAIIHLMAARVMKQGERLVQQAYDSVRRRTALILCDLHEQYGADNAIDLSREELAQMVGTTKESVIRAISEFKKEGLLTTKGRLIELTNPKGLYELLV